MTARTRPLEAETWAGFAAHRQGGPGADIPVAGVRHRCLSTDLGSLGPSQSGVGVAVKPAELCPAVWALRPASDPTSQALALLPRQPLSTVGPPTGFCYFIFRDSHYLLHIHLHFSLMFNLGMKDWLPFK